MVTNKERSKQLVDRLVALGSPEGLRKARIWGAILDGFTTGYNGLRKPLYIPINTDAHIAYKAGIEAKKREAK